MGHIIKFPGRSKVATRVCYGGGALLRYQPAHHQICRTCWSYAEFRRAIGQYHERLLDR